MKLEDLKRIKKGFGYRGVIHALRYSAVNKIIFYRQLQGMIVTMETLNPKYLKGNDAYTHTFLNEQQLRRYGKDPQTEMSETFLNRVLPKGDRCFAILDGETLASYGWYSTKPTAINPELDLYFDDRWVYMFKGYTHPSYRGQRLHAIGMAKALEAFTKEGYKGLISYVATNNFASLKSVYRMGYVNIGKVKIYRIFGKFIIKADEGCEKYKFTVKPRV